MQIFEPGNLLSPLVIPAIVGLIVMIIPRKIKYVREALSLLTTAYMFYVGITLFGIKDAAVSYSWIKLGTLDIGFDLVLNGFSAFLTLAIAFFGLVTILYSIGFFGKKGVNPRYYGFLLWTIAAAVGIVLNDNLLVLLIFWELVTVFLYFLVNIGQNKENVSAAKCFGILGLTDALMTFAILMIWALYGSLSISRLDILVNDFFSGLVFVLLFSGALAKAGAMPFHSWLPTISESVDTPVMAFLPASLDKLLGIYFLAKIALNIFTLSELMQLMMMIVGGVTILLAVMLALVQHDLKRLLSFHAVSQVGYMVLGIGTGSVVGIVGGLFHMLNNSVYKSLLFFNAGAIEKRTGTTELSKLGGLAKLMPITFITTVIAAFAISGIPPLNGFFSKWLIYRGLLDVKSVIFLVVAMFGSALTLASFVKVLHSTFLGTPEKKYSKVSEVPFTMTIPMIALAVLCILFGVFASYPLTNFIFPALEGTQFSNADSAAVIGADAWSPDIAAVLILIGLFVGAVFFFLTKLKKIRVTPVYIGGEKPDLEMMRFTGPDFYQTIKKLKFIGQAYEDSEKGWYDPYNFVAQLGSSAVRGLKVLHNGVLSTYLSWCLIGLAVLMIYILFG